MERIAQLLRKMSDATEADKNLFVSLHEYMSLKKGAKLIKNGQVESYLYYISDGVLRSYLNKEKNDDVKEITISLVFPDRFYSAYDSFISQTPCEFTTECVTDVELYRISYDNLQSIYDKTDFGQKVEKLATEQLYLTKSKREKSLLSDSVDERYLYLLNKHPQKIHQVPLKYIASYIGVTPQALSKIRKRIFKEN